jgi:hypothetical protein
MRRARTRSLILIGSLVEKAGLLETFDLPVGSDFQKDPELKLQTAALYKGLLVLNDMVAAGEAHIPTWSEQGLAALAETKKEKKMSG